MDAMELVGKLMQSLKQKYKDKTKQLQVRFGWDCVVFVLYNWTRQGGGEEKT